MDEAYTIAYKGPKDIKSTPYSDDQLDDIDKDILENRKPSKSFDI